MPQLAGVCDVSGTPDNVCDILERLLDVQGVTYSRLKWSNGALSALNMVSPFASERATPVLSDCGEHLLILDGTVFNETSLFPIVNAPHLRPFKDTATLCLRLFTLLGTGFVKRLNGQFNIVIYNTRTNRVLLFNDRLAYRPLYYSTVNQRLCFASEQKAVMALNGSSASFDVRGILSLFAFGHHLDGRTLFDNVKALPQASIAEYDPRNDKLAVETYWRPQYVSLNNHISIEEYADEFGRRLSNAAESRIGGGRRLGLFLSAGLDSRAVAGALHRSGSKFCTFTFARPHSSHHPDVVYARHIAKIYGCEHHEIAYTDDMFGEALPRAVWRTECAIPFAHSVSIQLHKAMMPHADWVFNGHFGGAFTRSDPRLFLCRNRKDVLRHIIKNRAYLKPPALGRIFRREFLKEHYNEMVCSIDRNLIEIGDARPPMLYNLWEKTAQCRWTFSSPAIDRYLFEQLSLYIDNDVLDWSLQIPLRYLFLERGFKLMILRTFPQIKEVPWARTKRPIPANLWRDCVGESFRAARFLTRRGLRKFIHSLKRQEPSIAQMHKRIRSSIERLYDSNGFDEKIFDIKNIRSMVMRHFDGQSVFWEEIELLATLAEGNRLFIERHCYEPPDDVQPVL